MNIGNIIKPGLLAGIALLVGSASSARADFNFNFNSLAAYSGSSDNTTAIAQYMDGVLGGQCAISLNCVTVIGAVTDRTYNGENHVVGPGGVSRTLGNTDGATNNSGSATATSTSSDTFLSTIVDGTSRQVSTEIKIIFSHGIVLNGPISFDYEIFPDATCPDSSHCSSKPDFKFAVNGGSPLWTTLGVFPSSGGSNGTSTHSPNSGGGTEQSAQYIGTYSGSLSGVTELDFIDWPAAIAIDNLRVATTPEPRGVALLLGGLIMAMFASSKLRRAFGKA